VDFWFCFRRAGNECSLKLGGFLVLFPVLHVSVVYASYGLQSCCVLCELHRAFCESSCVVCESRCVVCESICVVCELCCVVCELCCVVCELCCEVCELCCGHDACDHDACDHVPNTENVPQKA